MARTSKIPNRKIFGAFSLLLCLLALLAHPAHALSSAALLLFPALLFGLISVPRSLWPVGAPETACTTRWLAREPLFQRPPPRFSR
ncbi:MAG TPA: hypothetical protein VME18_05975 [Acidobacteriaceae bacterium]|nr:hypothetical protein [Acidobacteriaceae bacterium]